MLIRGKQYERKYAQYIGSSEQTQMARLHPLLPNLFNADKRRTQG